MGWVRFLPEEGFHDVGLHVHIEHDVERVDGFVVGVDVALEHDDIFVVEFFGFLGIKVMARNDHGEVLREITALHLNAVLEHVFGGLGAVGFVKGREVPILDLYVVEYVLKLVSSKLFVKLFGAKEVEVEKCFKEFSACDEMFCVGFSKVFGEKFRSFGDGNVG